MPNFAAIVCSFEAIELLQRFDLVFISEVLHLIKDKAAFLRKASDLTKLGGHIVIRAPSHLQLERAASTMLFSQCISTGSGATCGLRPLLRHSQ